MQLLQGCSCHFQAVSSLGGPFFCPCLSLPGLTLLQPAAQRPPSQPPPSVYRHDMQLLQGCSPFSGSA